MEVSKDWHNRLVGVVYGNRIRIVGCECSYIRGHAHGGREGGRKREKRGREGVRERMREGVRGVGKRERERERERYPH